MTGLPSPLVGFVGTTPNIGTTTAAFAAAYRMAEHSTLPVGFLCLNLKSSKLHRYLGVDRPAVTLDHLRPELRAKTLSPDQLLRSCYRLTGKGRLHVLFGNLMRDQAEFYSAEDIEHLLRMARQAFGIVVADVSAYWDNAATLTVLRRADTRVVATTPALTHFQEDSHRWMGQLSSLYGVPIEAYEAVIINPPWRNGGFTMRDIHKETGLSVLGNLRMTELMLTQIDSGQLGEWLDGDAAGKQMMRKTAERLADKHGLPRVSVNAKAQPWYRKLMEYRNGTTGS